MSKPTKYSRTRLLHAWISEQLLDFLGSLWKFHGGPIRLLQRYHATWNRRVFRNEIPPDTQLHLEQISMAYILPFGRWLKVQRKFAKALHRNRLRDRFWSMSYQKILENIEEVNQSSVHSVSWRNLGRIDYSKGSLRNQIESVEVHLYSLAKGHILIAFQVYLSASAKKELESLFKRRFRDLAFLSFGRRFWRSIGFGTESATLYKRYLVRCRLNQLKKEMYEGILKSLSLPKMDRPLSTIDLYSLDTKDPNIFQYEFWSCLNHNQNLPGFFILPEDLRYTLSVPNGHDDRDIKIVGDLRHFVLKKGYANLKDQMVQQIEHFTRELLQVWTYHTSYFSESNRIAHERFDLPRIYRKLLSLGIYRKESNLKARAFDIDMLSKDYSIGHRVDDLATSNFGFVERIGSPQVRLSDYLRDGIKYFKSAYQKSWREIEPFVSSFVEMRNAWLNRNLQIILFLFVLCEFMGSDWGQVFRTKVGDTFVSLWNAYSFWFTQ